jgi:hypothetical protein
MNGRSQIQGGENWILPKGKNANPVLLRISFAGKLEKPLLSSMGTNGRSVAMDFVLNLDYRQGSNEKRR